MEQIKSTLFTGPKLSGDPDNQQNYQHWRATLSVHLRMLKVYELVLASKDDDQDLQDEEEVNKTASHGSRSSTKKEIPQEELIAQNAIMCSLSPKAFKMIARAKTAKEMMANITSHYDKLPKIKTRQLLAKFQSMKMEDRETITKYVNRVKAVAPEVGRGIKENEIVDKLINTLTPAFNPSVSTLNALDEEKLTLSWVTSYLISEEERLRGSKDANKETRALFSKSSNKKSNGFKNKGKSIADKKKESRCSYCKKKGHWWKECRIHKEHEEKGCIKWPERKNPNQDHQEGESSTIDKGKKALVVRAALSEDGERSEAWIADGGSVKHITFQKGYFTTYNEFPLPKNVGTAQKGGSMQASGIGNIEVEAYDGQSWQPAVIHDVW